ncbi:alpha/beta hydrolase [Nocardioides sp. cx-173]|uniref:alpha/beta hydrolase n=1 Tax=Nocardioides sp. cx-173 TaxID=2898796 RepID=UPI001E609B40|nr:alpha/beta hydrolase [Nocardioides sp. cx-173]MCD4524472.1 alpha/beta hydrolase family protein [Nocardioides sp. cx-173]UGB43042.1 alpha/beta hydrolase family protein [Nocardioides sp. cx-173]
MTVIQLPPLPSEVPPLTCDPAAIRSCGGDLLSASTQVDDLGTFAASGARIGDWVGLGSTSYHQGVTPLGHRADAMSLALRGVAQRVQAHAEEMQSLLERRTDLVERKTHLAQQVAHLRAEAASATEADVTALQADCDRVATQVQTYETDLTTWAGDLSAEEAEMVQAFQRVLGADDVERIYGGVADPADGALASKPGGGASPQEVNDWWDSLTREQQQAIIAAAPGAIGNLDGIPAGARDAANTVAMTRDLADWTHAEDEGVITPDERVWLENVRAADEARHNIEDRTDPVTGEPIQAQVYIYDPAAFGGDGAIAISAGDLDTADNVAVVVPGLGTDGESAGYQADRAATMYEAARHLDAGASNAAMFWIGYDAPDNLPWDEGFDWAGVAGESMATNGGERLADTVDGLRAGRDGEPAHMTAVGHSYGSTTTGHAAYDHGLAVDDIVVVGSPGLGGDTDHASDLGLDPEHVWAGANSRDPVADLGNHGWVHGETVAGAGLGDDPAEDDFGAQRFQAESTTRGGAFSFDDHSKYFEHDTESLHNISQIVNGNYDAVQHAGHVHDPWYDGPQDPEYDRDPTSPTTTGMTP